MPRSHNPNPLNQSVGELENQLINISDIIGSLSGSNASLTISLARFINKLGKPLDEITLFELVLIFEQCNEAFNAGIEPEIKPVAVSPTKIKTLKIQHDIIGHALNIFELYTNQVNRESVKAAALELVRMLDELPNEPTSRSRFNVLTKAKHLIAKRIPFEQAMQYQNCIVKFAGMEA